MKQVQTFQKVGTFFLPVLHMHQFRLLCCGYWESPATCVNVSTKSVCVCAGDATGKQDQIMGTSSLTLFKDEDGTVMVAVYRQFDGNPETHGHYLCGFLSSCTIVDGEIPVGSGQGNSSVANGFGDLCAQAVAKLKTFPCTGMPQPSLTGNVYIVSPRPESYLKWLVEYVYTVCMTPDCGIVMHVATQGSTIFYGKPGDFDAERVLEAQELVC